MLKTSNLTKFLIDEYNISKNYIPKIKNSIKIILEKKYNPKQEVSFSFEIKYCFINNHISVQSEGLTKIEVKLNRNVIENISTQIELQLKNKNLNSR